MFDSFNRRINYLRISVTDWVRDGWTPEQSVIFARSLAEEISQ